MARDTVPEIMKPAVASPRLWALPALAAAPVTVAACAWRLRGRTHVTAIVKAAYRLAQDRPMEISGAPAIVEADVPRNGAPTASVRRPSDLAPFLAHPEITLDAVACAGAGRQVDEMNVRIAIARGATMVLSKELRVLGDRRGGGNERPLAFSQMPIFYERSFGGSASPANPAGVTMPNVVLASGAGVEPAGFGAIASSWRVRRARLKGMAYVDANGSSLIDIPEALDSSYFQAAPSDQWVESFKSGDLLVFVGLHPELATLRTSIPSLRGVAVVEGKRGNRAPVRLRLDSIFAEPHLLHAELTFRGSVEVPGDDLDGITIAGALEDPKRPFTFPALSVLASAAQRDHGRGSTLVIEPEAAPAKPNALVSTLVLESTDPEPETQRIVEPPPSERDLTVELLLDEAPPSLPFDRSTLGTTESLTAQVEGAVDARAATPWAREAFEPAPEVSGSTRATLVVEVPAEMTAQPVPVQLAPPPPAPVQPPGPTERRKVKWAEIPTAEATPPATPAKRPPIEPGPDRMAELYKKFKR